MILVGGEAGALDRDRPVLAAMGRTITHLGSIGSGQVAKAVNQVILCGTYLGVAEGIVLAIKAGLDAHAAVAAISAGAAASWVLSNRSSNMIDNVYPLGFKIGLHRKDMGIALELARSVCAVLPFAAQATTFEDGLIARGCDDYDISALAPVLRKLSGL
jgi:3-hydroxyisobutyrate dehydrogenase